MHHRAHVPSPKWRITTCAEVAYYYLILAGGVNVLIGVLTGDLRIVVAGAAVAVGFGIALSATR